MIFYDGEFLNSFINISFLIFIVCFEGLICKFVVIMIY